MRHISVSSIGDLIHTVEEVQREFRISDPGDIWYRGHTRACWSLVPYVLREFGTDHEGTMIQKFQIRARSRHSPCPTKEDYVGWFCLMQHYGLPTRLLDWSESIMVAAFFAVNGDAPGQPAAVWALSPAVLNAKQGLQCGIYNLGEPEEVLPLLHRAVTTGQPVDRAIAVMAPEIDPRMMVQQGVFTLHGSDLPLENMAHSDEFLIKITIAEAARAGIRTTLAGLGFRRSNLFPDLGNLATEISDTHRTILARQKGQTP